MDQQSLDNITSSEYIIVKNLSMHFYHGKKSLQVLDRLTFSVERNSFVAIVGPNGCGKTTLLYLIAGLYVSSGGNIIIDGKIVNGKTGLNRALVFEDYALFPWYTIYENTEFPLIINNFDSEIRGKRVKELLEFMGLWSFRKSYPTTISKGMQQKVALARALALDPPILLLDDPFSALDAQTRILFQRELLEIWQETKKTVILVTHSIDEAIFLSNKVIVLTARPARVKDIVAVDLPHRELDVQFSGKFVELKNRIWKSIKPEAEHSLREGRQ